MGAKQCKSDCCRPANTEIKDGPEKPADPEHEDMRQQLQEDFPAVQVQSEKPEYMRHQLQDDFPSVQAQSEKQSLCKYDGFWMGSLDESPVCKIENGKLRWRLAHAKETVDVTVNEKGELVMVLEGRTCTAKLVDGEVMWDDGETWKSDVKASLMSPYNGVWLNSSNKSPICEIKDGVLTWHTQFNEGETLRLTLDEKGKLGMTLEGQDCKGEINSGSLIWSDGDKWIRATPKDEVELSEWWDGDDGDDGEGEQRQSPVMDKIVDLLKTHEPLRLESLPKMLEKYGGDEQRLYDDLCKRYDACMGFGVSRSREKLEIGFETKRQWSSS